MALLLDDDGLVGHGGDIGTSSCARTHDDGDLWDTCGGHACLVVEDTAEVVTVWKDVGLVGEVGATAVDEVDAGKVVLLGDGLSAEMLLDGDGVVCAALDGAVVCDDDAGDAFDNSNTSDDTSSWDVGFRVQLMTSKRAELEESGAGIDECCNAITGKHLIPGDVLLSGLVGAALLDAE